MYGAGGQQPIAHNYVGILVAKRDWMQGLPSWIWFLIFPHHMYTYSGSRPNLGIWRSNSRLSFLENGFLKEQLVKGTLTCRGLILFRASSEQRQVLLLLPHLSPTEHVWGLQNFYQPWGASLQSFSLLSRQYFEEHWASSWWLVVTALRTSLVGKRQEATICLVPWGQSKYIFGCILSP